MPNWDDYRYLLAVEVAGSFSAAARTLGVSQPTVTRRISELEHELGVTLIDRLPEGYRLSTIGRRISAQAHLLERHAALIELSARGDGCAPAERVTITASEGIAFAVVTPLIARLCDAQPEIAVDLQISNQPADILRQDADIAVRIGDPQDERLIGRKIGRAGLGIYGHDSYLARAGVPRTTADLRAHALIESTGPISRLPQAVWLREHAGGARVAYSSDSLINQVSALSQGIGLVALPSYLAVDVANVRRVLSEEYAAELDVWLLSNDRSRSTPAVRTTIDFLAAEISRTLRRITPDSA